eukprot:15359681-Ditylum_brightwellii.AAC.1
MINEIIGPGPATLSEDARMFVPCTMEIVRDLMKQNKKTASVVSDNSLDKQCADGATRETRDHHFSKVNNYTHLLNKKGSSPYGPDIKNWPVDVLYNIDEIGLDITKYRNKVIAGKSCDRIFAVA